MDRLAEQTGEAVTLAMPAGGQVLTVAESGSSRTITDPGMLETELAAVRSRGYAVARGELEDGLDGLAVPVSDGTSCAAALCISGPDYRMNRRSETSDARACREAAGEIEQRLGAPSPSLTRQERGRP
jgi:DNA-binding IclR family transcriptional regulator